MPPLRRRIARSDPDLVAGPRGRAGRASGWCCLLLWVASSASAEIVVHSVAPTGEGERAGILAQDVLVAWVRPATDRVASAAQGSFSRVQDLRLVEIEQSPVGSVTLEVLRSGERRFVDMGIGVWSIQARPALEGAELLSWRRGQEARDTDARTVEAAWAPWIDRWRGEPGREADAVWLGHELAQVLQDAGDLEAAERFYEVSLAAVPEGDRRLRALTLERFAAFYADRASRPEDALRLAQQAVELWQEVDPEGPGTLYTLKLVSFLEMELGDPAASRATMRRQLAILEDRAGLTAEVGVIHHNLGYLHWLERDLIAAESEFRRAAAVVEKLNLGPDHHRSRHLMLGVIAAQRGDLEAAEFHHRGLVRIDEALEADPANMATSYGNLGATLLRAGKLDEAETAFARSLDIRRRIQPDSLSLAMTLVSVAQIQRRKGQLDNALTSLREARRIGETVEPMARVNGEIADGMGRVLRERGDTEAARREFETALELRRTVDPVSTHRANTAFELHEIAHERGDVAQAVSYCREAIETLDRYRASLGGTIEQQSRFGESIADRYHACASLFWQTGDAVASFELHERGRARIQRSLLADRRLRYDDADQDLLKRLEEAQGRYEQALIALRRVDGPKSPQEVAQQFSAVEGAYGRLEQVLGELRQAARRQAALSEPEPRSLAEIRASVPEGTLALSFSVGSRDTLVYAFGPRRGAFEVRRLDLGRTQVEDAVDRIVGLASRPSAVSRARLEQALDDFGRRLFGGIGDLLEPARRVLVVPDDGLYRVPFQLLRSSSEGPRLVEKVAVSIAPSLSLALSLERPRPSSVGTLRLAVVADPDLPQGTEREQTRRLLDLASPLERLPATAREAARIQALAPDRVRLFMGAEATEQRVRAEASHADVLHLATHAIADDRSPMESALVLSDGSGSGVSAGAGLLQAWEIVETFEGIAPLVTLSACETGRGGEFRNEGLLGLVSALWFAGAEQVVASLWQVADDSTADLMEIFYRHLLDGVAVDEALRRAQLAVWKGEGDLSGRDHPFYWASFQVYGALTR